VLGVFGFVCYINVYYHEEYNFVIIVLIGILDSVDSNINLQV
jgi:hypothetical protein